MRWAGQDCAGLCWTGLTCAGQCRTALGRAGLCWNVSDCAEQCLLDCAGKDCAGLCWTGRNCAGMCWTALGTAGLCWPLRCGTVLDCAGLHWTGPDCARSCKPPSAHTQKTRRNLIVCSSKIDVHRLRVASSCLPDDRMSARPRRPLQRSSSCRSHILRKPDAVLWTVLAKSICVACAPHLRVGQTIIRPRPMRRS